MTTFRKTAISTFAAFTAFVLLAPVAAMAQGGCDWYAKISLKQQSENVAKKCGFTGEIWSDKLTVHKNYCENVPPAVWKKVAQERKAKLATCK